jgi:hypothetical protein
MSEMRMIYVDRASATPHFTEQGALQHEIGLLYKSPFMTTPRIHLGLKPQAIGSNPLKRVHESIGVAVQPFNLGSGNLF